MEGEAYLCDGKVWPRQQVRLLAHYLKGKAYDFFMQKVATDSESWDLHIFFTELFNYCFPIDYWQQMRVKIKNIYQRHTQSISEYVHELQEVFNMVGVLTPELRVIKLWYSLWPGIQHGLHPDLSTWEEIFAKAKVIEIANKVVDPQEWQSGNQQLSSQSPKLVHGNRSQGRSSQGMSSCSALLTPNLENPPNIHNGNAQASFHQWNQNCHGGHPHPSTQGCSSA